ncbi:hypothetical protein SCACP_40320 [Sporomusa carbonis]|uniref:ECF transporter S component n=1 Tax=Sporomusa carbonis TaxID=3076075 RepID=UPI003A76E046
MPGFLGALFFGPAYGALIGAFGHLATAITSGFPLTLPVHFIIMITMAATMAIFGIIYKKFNNDYTFSLAGAIIAGLVAVIMNGPVSLLVLTPLLLPIMGVAGILNILPLLVIAATLNIVFALGVYRLVASKIHLEHFNNKQL